MLLKKTSYRGILGLAFALSSCSKTDDNKGQVSGTPNPDESKAENKAVETSEFVSSASDGRSVE